jgi:hypothetical protein
VSSLGAGHGGVVTLIGARNRRACSSTTASFNGSGCCTLMQHWSREIIIDVRLNSRVVLGPKWTADVFHLYSATNVALVVNAVHGRSTAFCMLSKCGSSSTFTFSFKATDTTEVFSVRGDGFPTVVSDAPSMISSRRGSFGNRRFVSQVNQGCCSDFNFPKADAAGMSSFRFDDLQWCL